MAKNELKPCPFCGGKARKFNGVAGSYGVVCKKCGAKTYPYASQSSATRAWQRRVSENDS